MTVLAQIANGATLVNVRQTMNAVIAKVDPAASLIQDRASIESIRVKVNAALAKLDPALPQIASTATFFSAATRQTLNTAIARTIGATTPTPTPSPTPMFQRATFFANPFFA